jgi:hypothetical protein
MNQQEMESRVRSCEGESGWQDQLKIFACVRSSGWFLVRRSERSFADCEECGNGVTYTSQLLSPECQTDFISSTPFRSRVI